MEVNDKARMSGLEWKIHLWSKQMKLSQKLG